MLSVPKLRLALFNERLHPFLLVFGGEHREEQAAFEARAFLFTAPLPITITYFTSGADPSSQAPIRAGNYAYCKFVMPNIVRLVGGDRASYEYLAKTTVNFPRRRALEAEWTAAGFREVRSAPLMLGSIALHVGVK